MADTVPAPRVIARLRRALEEKTYEVLCHEVAEEIDQEELNALRAKLANCTCQPAPDGEAPTPLQAVPDQDNDKKDKD